MGPTGDRSDRSVGVAAEEVEDLDCVPGEQPFGRAQPRFALALAQHRRAGICSHCQAVDGLPDGFRDPGRAQFRHLENAVRITEMGERVRKSVACVGQHPTPVAE